MQKMINPAIHGSRYLAVTPNMEAWGLYVSAAGRADVAPGVAYPVAGHPEDHAFDWERGRLLDTLQVVLITRGSGWLETKALGLQRVAAGMCFLLLPGVWHRYRPDAGEGWHECWVELGGRQIQSLLEAGIFQEQNILFQGAIAAGVEEQLVSIHNGILHGSNTGAGEMAADALRLLAWFETLGEKQHAPHRVMHAIRTASRTLSERHAEPLNMADVAAAVGMAYSHFRRSFKQLTGYSPWQYVLQVRMARARRILLSSDATLDEVAWRIGFHSAYHFSHAFKRAHGMAPGEWRKRGLTQKRPTRESGEPDASPADC